MKCLLARVCLILCEIKLNTYVTVKLHMCASYSRQLLHVYYSSSQSVIFNGCLQYRSVHCKHKQEMFQFRHSHILFPGAQLECRDLDSLHNLSRLVRLCSAHWCWIGSLWCVLLCTVALVNRGTCCEAHLLSGAEGSVETMSRGRDEVSGWTPPPPILAQPPVCLLVALSDYLSFSCVYFPDIWVQWFTLDHSHSGRNSGLPAEKLGEILLTLYQLKYCWYCW